MGDVHEISQYKLLNNVHNQLAYVLKIHQLGSIPATSGVCYSTYLDINLPKILSRMFPVAVHDAASKNPSMNRQTSSSLYLMYFSGLRVKGTVR